jgi:hypothetical protein
MTHHDIGHVGSAGKADAAGRAAWVRPALTRLRCEDAELGTRPTVADGAFSVS